MPAESILVPVAAGWLLAFWLCRELVARDKIPADWRFSLGLATGIWGAVLTVIVESVSLVHALNATTLLLAWLVADAALFAAVLRSARSREAELLEEVRQGFAESRCAMSRLSPLAKCCWTALALLAALLFGIAITTSTTNWDSISYHLPRVMHWIQQGTVEHFATDNSREIEFGPWSAFLATHLLLAGNDRLANLPQWFAMVFTCLLVSLLVKWLGKWIGVTRTPENERKLGDASAVAALLAATIPIGMMESMNPQTDYITTFWLVCLHVSALGLILDPQKRCWAPSAALAFGLGLLTKSTTVIYSAPLLVTIGAWLLLRRQSVKWKLALLSCFAGIVFLLNFGHCMRNYVLFGSPFGSSHVRRMVANQRFSADIFLSNLSRNLLLHANCGIAPLTRTLNTAVADLHTRTGVAINDPATTLLAEPLKFPEDLLVYEDFASATLHVLATAAAFGIALLGLRRNARLLLYVGIVIASGALLILMLKFQLYHSRFHLPILVLLCPFVALVLAQRARTCCWLSALAVTAFAYALICVRVNESRPVFDSRFTSLSHEEQYLALRGPEWSQPFQSIADEIIASGAQNVALKMEFNAFEYPLWAMLRNRGFRGRIDHCYVEDASAMIQPAAPVPDVIITQARSRPPAAVLEQYPFPTVHPPLMAIWAHKPPTQNLAGLNRAATR